MKKTAKIILIVVVVLIVLLVVAVFALNQYVKRPEFKDYVLAKTQEQVAVPLQVETMKVSLFSGFELHGLVVKNPPNSQADALLKGNTILFRYKFWPLLRKEVSIERITVKGLDVVLEKGADGAWNYEKLTKEEPAATKEGSGAPKTKSAGAPPSGLGFEISKLELGRVNVLMIKPGNKKLIELSGIGVDAGVSGSGKSIAGKGDLTIASAKVVDAIEAREVRSPLVIEQQQLKLTDLQGRIEDGTLKSTVALDLQKEGYPYTVHADIAGVDVGKLGAKFSDKAKYLTGKLKATTDLTGVGGDTAKLKGKGNAHVEQGTLTGVPLLQTIGALLSITNLYRIQFDEMTIEYAIDNGVIDTPVIKLLSKDVQVTGKGKTDFDFNLNHELTLALSPAIMDRTPKEVADQFAKRQDGFRTLTFNVTGPYDSPKTDLTERILKGAAGSLIDKGLQELLGDKKKKKEKPATQP